MTATARERFACYQNGEGRTAIDQLVEFTCACDETETVAAFLRDNVRTIRIPVTGRVSLPHGSYGQPTRYDVTQHKYAGGGNPSGGGWIEVLEIKNTPNGRHGTIINEYNTRDGVRFTEWETLQQALDAFESNWSGRSNEKTFPTLPGFKRLVLCGALRPWFYAIGDEQLIGDYAFPEGLQDDPVFRFGQKCVVFDAHNTPSIKTCMGTRFLKRPSENYPYAEESGRLVYFDDGSVWDERASRGRPPRRAMEGELWITDAIAQFQELLAGEQTSFTINLPDGNAFIGKLVTVSDEGKRWSGVFFPPPSQS